MASISTYAKLIKPPQFAANESATFRLEYSRDLTCNYATLRIDGYYLSYDGTYYGGYTQTQYINTSQSGTGIEEFIVPANSLAQMATSDDISVGYSGQMKAVIEIGKELNEDGTVVPLYYSNEIIVDVVWWWEGDFELELISATSPTVSLWVDYIPRNSVCTYGACDVNSYQVMLYDENYNYITQTEEFYDWNDSDRVKKVFFYGLEDNTTYRARAKVTLVGGYTRYCDYIEFTVKYTELPDVSSELEISNNVMKGCVNLKLNSGITHTKAVLSRTDINNEDYIELKTIGGNISYATLSDYYALPNKSYLYRLTLYNGDEVVGNYYNTITHKLNGLCIADSFGAYATEVYDSFAINKNDRAGIVEAMDSKKPYAVINGSVDYDSNGSVSAKFAEIDNCSYSFNPDGHANATISEKIRHWLNNGYSKLLKLSNGEAWIVSVSAVGTTYNNTEGGVATTTFGWTEIAVASSNDSYLEEGLIMVE